MVFLYVVEGVRLISFKAFHTRKPTFIIFVTTFQRKYFITEFNPDSIW
ncbi:MAG: hypothetical protein CM15mP130_0660 [Verrucomicrobiota bacterium]|nr:MAG: hypothetical protein CM15mP130_0660 [Verrucomicrobiota bacterium]